LFLRGNLRQAKSGTQKKPLHLWLTKLWLSNHPHLAMNHPCPTQIIDYWLTSSSPSHRLPQVLKAPEKVKTHSLGFWLPPGHQHASLCFSLPELLINSLYTHVSCHGFFLVRYKEFIWKFSDHRLKQHR
jgi:hypothetical protein